MTNADCDRVRPVLSARLDRELTDQTARDVTAHLSACPACLDELRRIERGRQLVALLPVAAPPASLRRDVLQRLAQRASAPTPHRVWRRPALALTSLAVILLGTAGAWQWSTTRRDEARATPAVATAGNPLHLERLTNAVGMGQFQALSVEYDLREVNVEEALTRASFKVLCPLQAEPGETLDDRHLTELRACPLVHLSSLRGAHRIVLLEQPADWPIVYGGAPVEHVTIAGQPCDRLHIRGREIIKWERDGTRSIIVAVAEHPEITKVARALIAASS